MPAQLVTCAPLLVGHGELAREIERAAPRAFGSARPPGEPFEEAAIIERVRPSQAKDARIALEHFAGLTRACGKVLAPRALPAREVHFANSLIAEVHMVTGVSFAQREI